MSNERVVEERDVASDRKVNFFKSKFVLILTAVLPLIVLGLMVYWFATKGTSLIETTAVPVEKLDFERIILHPEEIIAYVRNSGPTEITIAQVTVNEALWGASIY
ncbi:MAG: hypothetical protein HYW01_01410, partial [Deltaproteobacteria bacterium]|nr:hypothetical protein [Deltaproteobacteria bacterium]